MNQIIALIQARTSSSRLPGKVLLPLEGKPMILRQIERVVRSRRVHSLQLVTSTSPDDDELAGVCEAAGVKAYRGSLDDVLDRFYQAVLPSRPAHVVRITGDCPLFDHRVLDALINFHLEGGFDYSSNALQPTWPDGLDAEVMKFSALEIAWKNAKLKSDREHVTPFIYRNKEQFRLGDFRNDEDLSGMRWTVDEPEDFELVKKIYGALISQNSDFGTSDILKLLGQHPEWTKLNSGISRNEGYQRSLARD